MSQDIEKIPITVIVGPTAVGKTTFAVQLAEATNAEIVSADSRYFYRGMDIGTAKPTIEERRSVPHHLIDVSDPNEIWSLALFQQKAHIVISEIHQRGKNVIVAGGTGQYIRALLEGWRPPELQPDERLRRIIENWGEEVGKAELHQKLAIIDPVAASSIDYQNLRRTVRALEVIFQTGERFSDLRIKTESIYDALVIGLDRERSELYQRIDDRIDQMMTRGLLDEVRGLLAQGVSADAPAMSAIGYREICLFLQNEISLEEALALVRKNTRNYVRRQANWFKSSDPKIHWFDLTGL